MITNCSNLPSDGSGIWDMSNFGGIKSVKRLELLFNEAEEELIHVTKYFSVRWPVWIVEWESTKGMYDRNGRGPK